MAARYPAASPICELITGAPLLCRKSHWAVIAAFEHGRVCVLAICAVREVSGVELNIFCDTITLPATKLFVAAQQALADTLPADFNVLCCRYIE